VTSYKPVEAVMRGLDLLEALARLGACRTRDLQEATGLSGATVVRLMETLISAGYVYQDEPRGRYILSAKVRSLAAGYNASTDLAMRSVPALAALQAVIGWPSDVAVQLGTEMITIATTPASGRLSFNQPAGFRASMLDSSLGLAFLAFTPEAERETLVSSLTKQPSHPEALSADPGRLQRKLKAVRRLGYATINRSTSRALHRDELQTLGVPILVDGIAIAALNVIFLRRAVPLKTALREFLPSLRQTAAKLGGRVGSPLGLQAD